MRDPNEAPAVWAIASALWVDKWIVLICLVAGTLFGVLIASRPEIPRFSSTLSLQVVSRFSDRAEIYNEFQTEWRRTSFWNSADPAVTVYWDDAAKAAAIQLVTTDASGTTVQQYESDLRALADQFEANAIEAANVQLRELEAVGDVVSDASDYVAGTIHKMRLAIADASSEPGLIVIGALPPLTEIRSSTSGVMTIVIGAFLGLLAGVLLSIGRMVWKVSGRYATGAQKEDAPSPKPARGQHSAS